MHATCHAPQRPTHDTTTKWRKPTPRRFKQTQCIQHRIISRSGEEGARRMTLQGHSLVEAPCGNETAKMVARCKMVHRKTKTWEEIINFIGSGWDQFPSSPISIPNDGHVHVTWQHAKKAADPSWCKRLRLTDQETCRCPSAGNNYTTWQHAKKAADPSLRRIRWCKCAYSLWRQGDRGPASTTELIGVVAPIWKVGGLTPLYIYIYVYIWYIYILYKYIT